jgi:cytochrome c
MKLSGILSGAVVLLPIAVVAQAQGVGDAQRGAQVFAQCKVCHSLEAGKNLLGPSLHGLIVRKAGSVPGYAYSSAMKNANVTWDDDTFSKYLSNPKAFIPGDKMAFVGIKDPSKLGDLACLPKSSEQVAGSITVNRFLERKQAYSTRLSCFVCSGCPSDLCADTRIRI